MTERLFDLDSHLQTFSAGVLSCEAVKGGYAVTLDRTAFYPEGGGQPGDRGVLGGVSVTDTREDNGRILHFCDRPLDVGGKVTGTIDWPRRFRFMQQHSGEHLVSGFLHAALGYDNVGFHMGKDSVTMDFNGPVTEEQLSALELQVNESIWKNLPVSVTWPDGETLSHLSYRSKKELTGAVRLVEFPGVDLCACCGTHVKYTGEIGLVKFLSCVKFRDGVRIEMLAGRDAFDLLCGVWEQNRQVSALLSAKILETGASAARLRQELNDTKYRLGRMEELLFLHKAEAYAGQGDVLLFEEGLSSDGLRRLTDAVLRSCGGRCAVFSAAERGFRYAIGSETDDLRTFAKVMNQTLQGKGGGKANFIQGSVCACRQEIEAFFAEH